MTIKGDELWSFVKNSDNKQWVWLAIDRDTREIVGVHVGDRSRDGTEALWKSLPPVYRQCAVSYTDFWASYETALPSKRHRAVGKESGQTNHIERFNCTLRQRVSRLVRKTLSFSKNLANHVGTHFQAMGMAYYSSDVAFRKMRSMMPTPILGKIPVPSP